MCRQIGKKFHVGSKIPWKYLIKRSQFLFSVRCTASTLKTKNNFAPSPSRLCFLANFACSLQIERLGGCTAILEQCLYDVQLMTPDPRLHNLIHSTCPLFGPICTGLVAVEEAQMNMLVVLKKQLSLGKVSGIAILLEQRLQV